MCQIFAKFLIFCALTILSQTAIARVTIADVKEGTVIEDGALYLGTSNAAIPLPTGRWMVKFLTHSEHHFSGPQPPVKWFNFAAVNMDPLAKIQWFSASFNTEFGNFGFGGNACQNVTTGIHNDFGYKRNQVVSICGVARRVNVKNDLDDLSASELRRLGRISTDAKVLVVEFTTHKYGGWLLQSHMGVVLPEPLTPYSFDTTGDFSKTTVQYIQNLGEQYNKFLNGQQFVIPDFPITTTP